MRDDDADDDEQDATAASATPAAAAAALRPTTATAASGRWQSGGSCTLPIRSQQLDWNEIVKMNTDEVEVNYFLLFFKIEKQN